MDKEFFTSCYIAGFTFYEGPFVFGQLKIGTPLQLVYDGKNIHDDNAIEVHLDGIKLGFIPRDHNRKMAAIMKMGYDVFTAVVQQVSEDEYPEQQIRIAVYVKQATKK